MKTLILTLITAKFLLFSAAANAEFKGFQCIQNGYTHNGHKTTRFEFLPAGQGAFKAIYTPTYYQDSETPQPQTLTVNSKIRSQREENLLLLDAIEIEEHSEKYVQTKSIVEQDAFGQPRHQFLIQFKRFIESQGRLTLAEPVLKLSFHPSSCSLL